MGAIQDIKSRELGLGCNDYERCVRKKRAKTRKNAQKCEKKYQKRAKMRKKVPKKRKKTQKYTTFERFLTTTCVFD